jgi:predicted permease
VPAQRLRSVLVGGEIAVALVLLVGAGMLLRSLHALESVERGYDPNGLLSFSVQSPRGSAWAEDPAGFHEAIEARVAALPGVTDVGIGCVAPVAGHCMITGVLQAGEREWEAGSRPPVGIHYVGDGWFDALRTSVLEGRVFDSRDQEGSEPVVVLSRTAADELFPEGDALGSPIAMGVSLTPGDEGGTARIVGIVDDVLYDRPRNGLMAEAYVSHRQDDSYGTFIVRTGGDPLSLVPGVRAAVRELAPDVPVVRIRTLDEIEARAMAETRLLGGLLSAVAALAMLLACTGVWAAVSFSVARRRREFGVRLALGAPPTGMTASVVRSELLRAGAGVLVGVLVAAWGQRVLTALLFEVQPGDPWAFGGGAALLLAVAGLAAWIPARGAARVPPTVSLRAE